jgi:hypothetical protein
MHDVIPANAGIQDVDVILVPEKDDFVNPVGVKGIGELGNVAPLRPLPTQSIMRPTFAADNCRSGLRSCWRPRKLD